MADQGRVLVVDDNPTNRLLARSTLDDAGYAVVEAATGEEALAVLRREAFDCLLLDVRMPGVDGLEVCRELRAMPGGPELPVLFLTALRDLETFDAALAAGADDFLTKPVRPSEVVARVRTAIELRRTRAELRTLLKAQRDDLLRTQLQRERLSSFIVHDLKNPVNAMDLHAQLLERDKSLGPRGKESVDIIRSEARRLNQMIVNLLDVSRADEGKLVARSAQLELEGLIGEVFRELGVVATGRRVELRREGTQLPVFADPDLLRRVLSNLVENALRHSPAGSAVTVSAARDGAATRLCVADGGPGVPAELRERIFDPFVQGEGSVGRANRGLGLSFCRAAVQAHGGRIWVEDGAPGTLFCVSLPDGR